jgi:hypothetical protein
MEGGAFRTEKWIFSYQWQSRPALCMAMSCAAKQVLLAALMAKTWVDFLEKSDNARLGCYCVTCSRASASVCVCVCVWVIDGTPVDYTLHNFTLNGMGELAPCVHARVTALSVVL